MFGPYYFPCARGGDPSAPACSRRAFRVCAVCMLSLSSGRTGPACPRRAVFGLCCLYALTVLGPRRPRVPAAGFLEFVRLSACRSCAVLAYLSVRCRLPSPENKFSLGSLPHGKSTDVPQLLLRINLSATTPAAAQILHHNFMWISHSPESELSLDPPILPQSLRLFPTQPGMNPKRICRHLKPLCDQIGARKSMLRSIPERCVTPFRNSGKRFRHFPAFTERTFSLRRPVPDCNAFVFPYMPCNT